MKILSWNVRGLGKSRTMRCLKNKLRHIQPQILFLMETKVTSKRMESIRRRCGFTNGIDVDAVGSRGSKRRIEQKYGDLRGFMESQLNVTEGSRGSY
ncbi:reverse transcriptase [Gossypium australe]|uniref:Reverse transcriptase n=1 Tax=Gossypium australe TaxID=47621 RepID=A0A5B6VUE3_9ROSI|nr:reverse transcriptase [Gossypium australe]